MEDVDGDGARDILALNGSYYSGEDRNVKRKVAVLSAANGRILHEFTRSGSDSAVLPLPPEITTPCGRPGVITFGLNGIGLVTLDGQEIFRIDDQGVLVRGACFSRLLNDATEQYSLVVALRGGADFAHVRSPLTGELLARWPRSLLGTSEEIGGSRPRIITLGDCDEDGWEDVVVSISGDGTAEDRLNLSARSGVGGGEIWRAEEVFDPQSLDARGLTMLGDVDGDGFRDLAVGGGGLIHILSGKSGTWIRDLVGPSGTDWGTVLQDAGDVDADGYPEILVICADDGSGSGPGSRGAFYEIISTAKKVPIHTGDLLLGPIPGYACVLPDADDQGNTQVVVAHPVRSRVRVDFLTCDDIRAPHSWVELVPVATKLHSGEARR